MDHSGSALRFTHVADHDPDPALRTQPVPGANDGASGVAVLLELARSLPETLHAQVWLVFFDAEDQGDIQGWDWILGSRAFAQQLTTKPDAVVVIDMIGDKNLDIYYESNSDRAIIPGHLVGGRQSRVSETIYPPGQIQYGRRPYPFP